MILNFELLFYSLIPNYQCLMPDLIQYTPCTLHMVSHHEHMIIAGKPVTGEHLIGRREEITAINQYLDLGQSVVLIAPRRYGKTSLLLETLKQRS